MYVLDDKVGRRKFLRVVGTATLGTTAAASVSGCVSVGSKEHTIAPNSAGATQWGREEGEWIPSLCHMCGGQSGILVHVVNGVVEKIEPNHWNPNNYSNISSDFFAGYTEEFGCAEGGAICPKGNAGIMQLYDPDRVKKPRKRTNPDKSPGADPKWQEISWDQALDEIAAKMRALRDAGEAHKLLWITEDASFTDIQGDFMKLFGSPNFGMHSNLCDVARKASFKTVMGHDRPLADFIQSKYILLFGWNPTAAIKWVYLPRIITRAVDRGARLVVVDPYLSDTAAKAHEWVSIRPGTDGAFALAMAHVIIRDKIHDADFVAKWTVGFEEYADYVKDKTPQWAEQITSVSAAKIERIAREFATTKPAVLDVWSGPGHHTNGVQGGRAIACLTALVGGYDRPGTLMIPDKGGPKHADLEPDERAAATLKNPRCDESNKYPLAHASGVYCQLFDNLAADKGPYQPKMMVSVFQNPMMSVPGSATVAKAFAKLETLVVIDTMESETARMADYLLPGTNYLERYDLQGHWVTWPVIALRQPAVPPLFGQLAEYETVVALARRLGLKTKDGKDFFSIGPLSGQPIASLVEWYKDYLSFEMKNSAAKITLGELQALPGAVWLDKKGTRYEKYAEEIPAAKLATYWFDGDPKAEGTGIYDKPKDQGGKRVGIVVGDKPVAGFATPSSKIEFVSKTLAGKKDAQGQAINALPVYEPREWQPNAEYPLYHVNWKEASHTHTRTQNNAWLLDIKPDNPLIVHPDTAARYGVADDDEVWVESKYGKVRAKAKTTKRMHPEVVGLQHGFGHTALGSKAKGRGTSDSPLRPTKADPISGQALHKEACVKVYKA